MEEDGRGKGSGETREEEGRCRGWGLDRVGVGCDLQSTNPHRCHEKASHMSIDSHRDLPRNIN